MITMRLVMPTQTMHVKYLDDCDVVLAKLSSG